MADGAVELSEQRAQTRGYKWGLSPGSHDDSDFGTVLVKQVRSGAKPSFGLLSLSLCFAPEPAVLQGPST